MGAPLAACGQFLLAADIHRLTGAGVAADRSDTCPCGVLSGLELRIWGPRNRSLRSDVDV